MSRQRVYYERGQPVQVLTWWAGRGPRNVLIERGDGTLVVRPFRGLRRNPPRVASREKLAHRDGGRWQPGREAEPMTDPSH